MILLPVATSQFDILTQKAPTQTSLTEEGRKNPIVIGVVCTLLFHILLFIVARLLPVGSLSGTHPNLDAIAARKNKTFDFQLERLPEAEVQPDKMKFVETNPDAPANEPDKTANVSNRNQQTAQEVAATEIDPEKRPSVKGDEKMENNAAIVAGDHTQPQDAAAAANSSEKQAEEHAAQQARAEQIPISGIEKNEGKSEDGLASNISPQHDEKSNDTKEYLDGAKDGKGDSGGMTSSVQSSKPQPKPRPKLTQARQNVLSNQLAGTTNVGPIGIDARWSEYGEYMQELIEIIQAQWYSILEESKMRAPGTHVDVTFKLNSNGEVSVIKVEETAGKPGTYACLNAIQERQPYRKWTAQMIAVLGPEQTMTFRFYYQ